MAFNTPSKTSLIIPALQPLYSTLSSFAPTIMRVMAGIALVAHGWPKIQNPMGAIDMVEGIGFQPGWLWSPALAATEFFGGILLVFGLLTRVAALGATIILLVTTWFHWVKLGQGYSGAELSLIWATVTFYFVAHGGGRHSLDRLIGKEV